LIKITHKRQEVTSQLHCVIHDTCDVPRHLSINKSLVHIGKFTRDKNVYRLTFIDFVVLESYVVTQSDVLTTVLICVITTHLPKHW